MPLIKVMNKRSGQFCNGSMDFDFDKDGKVFRSKAQLERYVRLIKKTNKSVIDGCINDLEVVEFELTPVKVLTQQISLNSL